MDFFKHKILRHPFDPYPFVLLTTIVSLEAIFLAIFVLVSQNRLMRIQDLRQELNLQIDMIAEEEITKIIRLLQGLYKGLNIELSKDSELKQMSKRTDPEIIEKKLHQQMDRSTSNK